MPGKKYFSLEEIATITGSRLSGNPEHLICGASDLEAATTEDASFFSNARYIHALKKTNAGVIFIDLKTPLEPQRNYLISEQPSRAFQLFLDTLHPPDNDRSGFRGIHPTAVVHASAAIGENVSVGPCAVIDEETVIGSGTFVGSGSYIGKGSVIGQDCLIHPRVVIREECKIGDRVIVQPGAIIGSCGFGYVTDEHGTHTKLNQIGYVVIEDDVEIGANTTIDRARFKETRIGRGSKIDNLVQIAHGVSIGPHNIIIAQTGIAGSSSTGHHVILAGQVAVAGHLHLESGVTVAGKSGVTKSLAAGKYGGIPAIPLDQYNRVQVFLRNIEKYIRELKLVIKKLNQKDT